MQAVNKLSNYVSNKSFAMFPPVMNSLIVCWHVQFFSNLRKHRSTGLTFCTAIKLLWRKTLIHRRQRKLRLLDGRSALVTFHLFLVGATNIFSELIHPLLKLLNCVLKQQPHILQLSEVIGTGFSLFEEQE